MNARKLKTYYLRSLMVLSLCLITISSCNDWLEIIPPDSLVLDEYWKSKEDLEATLMGAYQKFAGLNEMLFTYGELRADMIVTNTRTSGNQRDIANGIILPDNGYCYWGFFYEVINICNNILKYAPEILKIDNTFTEYQMKGFEAEAIFLRSLAYFYLLRIYKEVPLVLEPSESDDVDFYLPKSSETTILNYIREELDQARFYVTDDYGSDRENIGRATKGAILALLADISLWNFNYEDCIAYVNKIEDLGYLLLPGGKWFDNYYPGNSLEGIFEFQFDQQLGDQRNDLYDYTYYQGGYYEASPTALELLTPELSYEIIRGPGSVNPFNAVIWKYCGRAPDGKSFRSGSDNRSANWIVYRYADVLLMKAEALSQTGNYEEALKYINRIRTRALVSPAEIPFTAEAFEDAILDERAVELAFEGKRWFDLMRLGRRNNYKRRSKFIEIIIENIPSTQKFVMASKLTNPMGWYLPIYQSELERNPNLEQNPYYEVYSRDD